MRLGLVAAMFALAMAGCAREKIPTYSKMDAQQSLQTMRERTADVEDVSGSGTVTLTDQRGRSVRLEAAFVLRPPGHARLRAWKFGQAVLDLTVTPQGMWLYAPKSHGRDEEIRNGAASAGDALRELMAVAMGRMETDDASVKATGGQITVTSAENELTTVCTIDRRTLTVRRYEMLDTAGRVRYAMMLDRYKQIESMVWPGRVRGSGEGGRVVIESREVELNAAPESAFKPPARAEKIR